MKRLLLFNLFAVVCLLTHAQVTNSFPDIGKPAIGGSNYMSISNRMFFQAKNQDINGYNRGIVANNLYWDSAQSKWTNGTGASFDFAMMRFESGGNISFFNGPVPDPSARQTFTNSELEAYRTVTIKSNGNVGIGTSNPTQKLYVAGTAYVGQLQTSTINKALTDNFTYDNQSFGNYALGWTLDSWANSPTAWFSGFAGIKFFTQRLVRMSIDYSGNVGIGTTDTKGYKLAVNGPAIFTKAVVKAHANWPDYVFNNSYQLMPLDSLEIYIQQKHHLPNMPTASDIQNNGIDIGETESNLLQKIEELTKYVIEQHNINLKQQQEITQLKKQMEELKSNTRR